MVLRAGDKVGQGPKGAVDEPYATTVINEKVGGDDVTLDHSNLDCSTQQVI